MVLAGLIKNPDGGLYDPSCKFARTATGTGGTTPEGRWSGRLA